MNYKDLNIEEKYEDFKSKKIEEMYEDLKEKVESKRCSQKEYKEYLKVCNLKDNLYIIENLMNYINDLKNEILRLEKEKENRQMYRDLQQKELSLLGKKQGLEKECSDLKEIVKANELEEDDKRDIEERIKSINERNKNLEEELKKVRKQKNEIILPKTKKIYSYEEQRNEIFKIKEKIYPAAITLDYLLKGNSWDETLEYYMKWQNSKYKLDSRDIDVVKDDIKRIRYDTKLGNDIVKIAQNYDEIKNKEKERE